MHTQKSNLDRELGYKIVIMYVQELQNYFIDWFAHW